LIGEHPLFFSQRFPKGVCEYNYALRTADWNSTRRQLAAKDLILPFP
jgi:hypothetical protein